jgi:phage-related protein
MDTFSPPRSPSVAGVQLDEQGRVITTNYGDGYVVDLPDGINVISGAFSLSWSFLYPTECDTIVAFFRSHIASPFYYTLPGTTETRKWIPSKWTRTYPSINVHALSVTLTERPGFIG